MQLFEFPNLFSLRIGAPSPQLFLLCKHCNGCLSQTESSLIIHSLIQVAMEMAGVEGIYVLTDGKPNSSMSLVLERVSRMNSRGRVKINTISFNCFDGWVSVE